MQSIYSTLLTQSASVNKTVTFFPLFFYSLLHPSPKHQKRSALICDYGVSDLDRNTNDAWNKTLFG